MSAIEASLRLEIAQFKEALARSQGEVVKFKEKVAVQGADLDRRLFEKTEKHKLQLAEARKGVVELREDFRRKGAELRRVLFDPLEKGPVKMGSGRGGMAALQIAQFVDDAQYGLRGIMNNIPGVVMAIGGSAGIAGALSIAAVGGKVLWDMFSGSADEAERNTAAVERLKAVMAELAGRLDAVNAAQRSVFDAQLGRYVTSVQEAANAWDRQKQNIAEALGYQQQMSAAVNQERMARMRLDAQQAMAQQSTDSGRARVSAEAGKKMSAAERTAFAEDAARALESAQLAITSQAARRSEAEAAVTGMRGRDEAAAQRQREIAGSPVAQNSDQMRRLAQAEALQIKINALNEQDASVTQRLSKAADKQAGWGATDSGVLSSLEGGRLREQQAGIRKQMEEAHAQRAALMATRDEDMTNVRGGKLTFTEATKEAESNRDANSLKAYKAAEAELAAIQAERATYAAELTQHEKALAEAAHETRRLEQAKLLLQQQQAAAAAQMEATAAEQEKQAQETIRKQQESEEREKRRAATLNAVMDLESRIAAEQARSGHADSATVRNLRDRISVLQLTAQLQDQLNLQQREAAQLARGRVTIEREAFQAIEQQQKQEQQFKALGSITSQMRATALRATGRDREAEKVEREERIRTETARIQEATGFDAEKSGELAKQHVMNQERVQYRQEVEAWEAGGRVGPRPRNKNRRGGDGSTKAKVSKYDQQRAARAASGKSAWEALQDSDSDFDKLQASKSDWQKLQDEPSAWDRLQNPMKAQQEANAAQGDKGGKGAEVEALLAKMLDVLSQGLL